MPVSEGPETASRTDTVWHDIALAKPQQNSVLDSFNDRLRDESLNEEAFGNLSRDRHVQA